METSTQSININNITNKESLFVLWQMLTKAQSKGVYTLDEACAIKASIQKLNETVEKLHIEKVNVSTSTSVDV